MKFLFFKSKMFTFLAIFILLFSLTSFRNTSESPEKFIGTTQTCSETYSIEPGSCYRNCTTTFQMFWLVISEDTQYGIPC